MSAHITALNLPFERCADLYSYDPLTGEFTTKIAVSPLYPVGLVRPPSFRKPKPKGRAHACINLEGKPRRATHVAYMLMTGDFVPSGYGVYFRDGDGTNLRWENLVLLPTTSGGVIPALQP
jgi:hypothetical protein